MAHPVQRDDDTWGSDASGAGQRLPRPSRHDLERALMVVALVALVVGTIAVGVLVGTWLADLDNQGWVESVQFLLLVAIIVVLYLHHH